MTMGTGADRDTIIVAMGKDELERAPGWQKSREIIQVSLLHQQSLP
jgi:hypothetical protein